MKPRPSPYHEVEVLVLKSAQKQSRRRLHEYLCAEGFASEDDFYYLNRRDKIAPWQSSSLVEVSIFLEHAAVYGTQEDIKEQGDLLWDELHAEYLFATLPRCCIGEFLDIAFRLAEAFNLGVWYGGKCVSKSAAMSAFLQIADQLVKEVDEPGSESLRILIQMHYER